MSPRIVLAVLTCLVLPLPALAQDTYTIKTNRSTKGTTTREHKVETEVVNSKVTDLGGKVLEEEASTTTVTSTFEQTVLERPDLKKKPTVLKRTYEKAIVKEGKETKQLPYEGKSILIEKKDGKYHYRYASGGDINGHAAKWLDKEFKDDEEKSDVDFEQLLLPTKAVAVGESWKISMTELVKDLEKKGIKVQADKSTGTGTLLKAYKKDGRQFGDLHFKLDFPLKSLKVKDSEISFQLGSTIVIEAKTSVCIDGSLEDLSSILSWQWKGTGVTPPDNPQVRVEFSIRSTVEVSSIVLKK
jgi:hypothetical protein